MNMSWVLAADAGVPTATGPARGRPSLPHCLVLAGLLHLLVVALVGTAPGGPALPGDGVWGAIQIRLSGAGPADSPGRADTPQPSGGPAGRAPEARFGGTVRDALPRPTPEPGAAELGTWSPQPSSVPLSSPGAPAQAAADPQPAPAPPPIITRRDRPGPERREDPVAEPAATPALPELPPKPAPEATPSPSTAPRLSPVDTTEAPVLQRPTQSQRDIANPVAVPTPLPRPAPAPAPARESPATTPPPAVAVTPPRPAPVAEPPSSPSPAVLPSPPVSTAPNAATAADPAPRPLPTVPAQPSVDPVVRPLPPVPAPAPELPSPPLSAPPSLPAPSVAPVDATALPRAAAPDLAAPAVRAVDVAPAVAPSGTGPASTAPAAPTSARPPTAGLPPSAAPGGAPDAGARMGADRATPAGPAASAARLNLDLPRARAPLPGLASPRVLNLVPPPPERKSPLAEGIEKAAKPDCRKAYAGMGPLAVLPLAIDAVRDGGCRW